jgi:hypothetical protein
MPTLRCTIPSLSLTLQATLDTLMSLERGFRDNLATVWGQVCSVLMIMKKKFYFNSL